MDCPKRQVRQQIARQRHRLERRLRTTGAELLNVRKWSAQLRKHPETVLLSAFGGGLAVGMGGGRSAAWPAWATQLLKTFRVGRRLWREFQAATGAADD